MTTTFAKGRYGARVFDQGFDESSTKRTPGFYLQLKILGRYDTEGTITEFLLAVQFQAP
jgi:hypothetical protein